MSSFETLRTLPVQHLWNDYSHKGAPVIREERTRSGAVAAVAYPQPEISYVVASEWTLSQLRRVLDFVLAFLGIAFFGPLLCLISLAIWISSPGPVIFRQQRVGRLGQLFIIYKFRTMEAAPQQKGLSVTRHGDRRITRLGRFLRRYKLDELPQLVNVLVGDMSLVGPRPKLPDHQHRHALLMPFRPGITGAATLVFRCEEEMLRQIPEEQLVAFCRYKLTPYKTQLDYEYAENATCTSDVRLMLRTAVACLIRGQARPPQPSSLL